MSWLAERLNRAESRTALRGGLAALAVILWGGWMTVAITVWPAPYWFEHRFHHGIDSPVLALELARNQSDIDTVLQRGEEGENSDLENAQKAERALFLNTVLDCVFIPIYAAYLYLIGAVYVTRAVFKWILTGLIAGTVFFDYVENGFMFAVLRGNAVSVYLPSLTKWLLLGLALLALAKILLGSTSGPYSMPTRRLLGVAHLGAAGLILLGVAWSEYAWLALGTNLFAFTVGINLIGLLGPIFAIEGRSQEAVEDFCEKRRRREYTGPSMRDLPQSSPDRGPG